MASTSISLVSDILEILRILQRVPSEHRQRVCDAIANTAPEIEAFARQITDSMDSTNTTSEMRECSAAAILATLGLTDIDSNTRLKPAQ